MSQNSRISNRSGTSDSTSKEDPREDHLPASTDLVAEEVVASTSTMLAPQDGITTTPTRSTSDDDNPPVPSTSSSGITEHLVSYQPSGRRIIDLKCFFDSICKFQHHGLFKCGAESLFIRKERFIGLKSQLTFECSVCKATSTVSTEDTVTDKLDINRAAVLGTISTGGGYTQLEELMGFCDIPCMSFQTFSAAQDDLALHIHQSAYEAMEEAGKEEAQLAKELGEVDRDGIPKISVVADGAWCKRSYKSNYNASSGVGVIVGYRTKKILYLGIKNKFCYKCAWSENRKVDAGPHKCFKNWNKTSTSMEAEIIAEGFKCSVDMHNLKYAFLIGDGDSSVSRKLKEVQPYGNLFVHKIECRNHLLRNFCNNLKDAASKRVSSSRGIVSVEQREFLKNNIRRFRSAVQCAVKYRVKEDCSHEDKVSKLRADIVNSVYHIFGDHTNCADYFCKQDKTERNWIEEMRHSGLLQDVEVILQRLVHHADSLLLDMDNNAAECYNSVVAKFVGGKRINFSTRGSYQLRCEAASISYNVGAHEYPGRIHKAITKKSPGKYTKRYMDKFRKRYLGKITRKQMFPEKAKRKFKTPASADADYGPDAALLPSELPPDFEEQKETILASFQKSVEEIQLLERKTVGQSSNRLWKEERHHRLTASNFGKICKQRTSTSCAATVRNLLYCSFSGGAATDWGKTHEHVAIREFEIKFDIHVTAAGLVVDAVHGFLAASPDGFIADDGLLEIKCPYSIRDISPKEAIIRKKLVYCYLQNDVVHLKRTSDYYYQVQGQLHITGRDYCCFVIWTPLGMEFERIDRDDNFWAQKMEVSLVEFYHKCMLPEIIDPQHPRGLPIRDLRERKKS